MYKTLCIIFTTVVLSACAIQPLEVMNTTCRVVSEQQRVVDTLLKEKQELLVKNPGNMTLDKEVLGLTKTRAYLSTIAGYCSIPEAGDK